MNLGRNVMHRLFALMRAFAIVLIAVPLLAAAMLGYARLSGRLMYSVQSASMSPAILPGSAILVEKGAQNLQTGNIVSFTSPQYPGLIVTHRIVQIDRVKDKVVTRGDAASDTDLPIPRGQIIGRTVRIVPLAGYGLEFVRSPAGLILLLYIPALFLASGEFRRLAAQYESRYYRLRSHYQK